MEPKISIVAKVVSGIENRIICEYEFDGYKYTMEFPRQVFSKFNMIEDHSAIQIEIERVYEPLPREGVYLDDQK